EAVAAARKMTGNLPPEMIAQMSMLEFAPPYVAMTLARFGRWDEVLKEPLPPSSERFACGLVHYARGLAFAAQSAPVAAAAGLDWLRTLARAVPADMPISINHAGPLFRIAASSLAGAIAIHKGKPDDGLKLLRLAVASEDSLHYDEPPTWYYPVRHTLGATLLTAGRAAEAAGGFREDLRRHPGDRRAVRGGAGARRAPGRAPPARGGAARARRARGP